MEEGKIDLSGTGKIYGAQRSSHSLSHLASSRNTNSDKPTTCKFYSKGTQGKKILGLNLSACLFRLLC